MSSPTPPPLTPDQLGIIAAYRAFSAVVAGPRGALQPGGQIVPRPQPTITDIKPPDGRAGTTVKITGSELETATAVVIGNQQVAPNRYPLPTEVQFDVPRGLAAGSSKIAVKTSLGTAVSIQDFTVR